MYTLTHKIKSYIHSLFFELNKGSLSFYFDKTYDPETHKDNPCIRVEFKKEIKTKEDQKFLETLKYNYDFFFDSGDFTKYTEWGLENSSFYGLLNYQSLNQKIHSIFYFVDYPEKKVITNTRFYFDYNMGKEEMDEIFGLLENPSEEEKEMFYETGKTYLQKD